MAFIKADGTIAQEKPKRTTQALADRFRDLPTHWKAILCVGVAFLCHRCLNSNPLANGKVPAADHAPDQHWERILRDDLFMRTMSEHLGSGAKGKFTEMRDINVEDASKEDIAIAMGGHDFGGPDGHVAEAGDWSDLKYVQGTRCSTTRSALTAYFCGAKVAGNLDVALGEKRKLPNVGVGTFSDFITCRHKQGQQKKGGHRRAVYRLGIGCQDPLAGYSHAFSIVAQPDGSFYWLQSFIGHYSLQQWMRKPDAQLSLGELLDKLAQVQRLMNITSWTDQANTDYYQLFGVDKNKEKMRRVEGRNTAWQPTHRLAYFVWDEACEYPTPDDTIPSSAKNDTDDNVQGRSSSDASTYNIDMGDECTVRMYQQMFGMSEDRQQGDATDENK